MSKQPTARDIIAQADSHRAIERAADLARTKIRLGQQPETRSGVFGFFARAADLRDQTFTAAETSAIYEALAVVQAENRRAADQLEKKITVTEADR